MYKFSLYDESITMKNGWSLKLNVSILNNVCLYKDWDVYIYIFMVVHMIKK